MDGLRFLFVKDMDVPTYVEYGVADCGIAGRDVLLETGSDVYEPLDLGFGRCRLVVARPRGGARLSPRASTRARRDQVPAGGRRALPRARRVGRGGEARGLGRDGARASGLADCIVDVVETGRTLEENGLEVGRGRGRLVARASS